MEGKSNSKHFGKCALTQTWAWILPTGGISSSADSDGEGLRLEPRCYCLIVLSRKYDPLCFRRGGGGPTPPPATRNHIQLNKRSGLLPVELWFKPPPPAASTAASTSAPPPYLLPLRSRISCVEAQLCLY